MREIKIRAWDSEFEKMIYDFTSDGYFIDIQNGVLNIGSSDGDGDYFSLSTMLYSGLNDRVGKEIFASDILQCSLGTKSIVVFRDGVFYKKYTGESYSILNLGNEDSLVIGNIYENSELLK